MEILRDLLESAKGSEELNSGKFYFAHSETVMPLLAQLEIAKDQVKKQIQIFSMSPFPSLLFLSRTCLRNGSGGLL